MENTLENKSKFFAQYWGQQITYDNNFSDDDESKSEITQIKFQGTAPSYLGVVQRAYLELTPLSQISDEDAIIVAKLRGFVNIKNVEIVQQGYYVNRPNGRKSFIFFVDMWQPEIDFLRSKGYAVKYFDLEVEQQIEYGWAKLKTN